MSGTEEDRADEQLDWYSDTMPDVDNDIIDISVINFGNNDSWLQPSIRNPSEYRVHDLRAWLRADVEQDSKDLQDSRRSIDTRTFTRPKRRSGRLSFESIAEATLSPSADVWKPRVSENTEMRQLDEDYTETIAQRRDSMPAMLRPANHVVDGVCSADAAMTSGPESLEAFLNMSQSKGIDSFINLVEPEFSDAVMNISQPSILGSSMLSQTLDQSQAMNQSQTINQSSIMDSQILTESMMQSSMFGDTSDVHFNDIFTSNNADVTVLENTSFHDSHDKTFVDLTVTHLTRPLNGTYDTGAYNSANALTMDATYTPSMLNKTLGNSLQLPNDPHASYTVNQKCQISDSKHVANDASFVISKDIANNASFVVRNEITNLSYVKKIDRSIAVDATFDFNNPQPGDQNETFDIRNFDATYDGTQSSVARKLSTNANLKVVRSSIDKRSMESNVSPANAAADRNDTFDVREFDATFEKNSSPSSARRSSTNSPFGLPKAASPKPSVVNDDPTKSTFKAPTSAKMDATYDNNIVEIRDDVPMVNRYNTYRKNPIAERARNENYATNNLTRNSSNETVNIGSSVDNLDATFDKPAQKVTRKLNAPRALSRLPQTLQKSNPNLISNSLKASSTVGRTAIPSFGFSKLARPTIVRNPESSLAGKLYGLAKMKSGSEQRLEIARNVMDFGITGTGGSTESIESTQSAHSAPDFDDRLSVCSDSSHTSYSMRTMNIKDLQKSGRLHAKPESTPKPNRRVLENAWVEASNDLPSPILKNGNEIYERRGSSPGSTESTVKTSSPLLSPVGSLGNLTVNVTETNRDNNADGKKILSPRNHQIAAKKTSEATIKPAKNSGENKTGLRLPSSLSSGIQRPASGIPRPASRIPAPRFTRPATKINQGDIKKGCL